MTLANSEIQKLTQFHKKFLKQVMHLHERTADTAVYILSGQLLLVADLHKRVLGTLGSVLHSNSIERGLAERQILLKDKKILKLGCLCRSNPISVQFAKYN